MDTSDPIFDSPGHSDASLGGSEARPEPLSKPEAGRKVDAFEPKPDQQTQSDVAPLTYEQEVHALLCAAGANTEGLLVYFEAQSSHESGDAKKLTQKCIDWKREDLRRIQALIPQAQERRDAALASSRQETPELRAKVESILAELIGEVERSMDEANASTVSNFCDRYADRLFALPLLEPLVGSRNAMQAEHDALVKCKDWLIRYGVHGQPLCEKRGCICGLNNAKDVACRALKTLDAEEGR
jgi:hypothetical protein